MARMFLDPVDLSISGRRSRQKFGDRSFQRIVESARSKLKPSVPPRHGGVASADLRKRGADTPEIRELIRPHQPQQNDALIRVRAAFDERASVLANPVPIDAIAFFGS